LVASKNATLREALKFRLTSEGRGDLAQILEKCAKVFQITCLCCGKKKEVEEGCKKRWCPVCAPKITGERVARFSRAASEMEWPLAVTLTGPNVQNIAGQLRAFRAAIKRFRRQKFWGSNVTSGIVSFETTHLTREERIKRGLASTDPTGWHVHAHLLVDSRWLALRTRCPRRGDTKATVHRLCEAAHRELSEEWGRCLGLPSAVTWVERAYGKALLETVKYAVKPAELIECAGRASDLIDEMKNMKLVNGFGTMHGQVTRWKKEDAEARGPTTCDECGGVEHWMPSDVLNFRLSRGAKWI
jgi:hypothetical protein